MTEMKRFHQIAALLFLGLSGYMLYEARSMQYYTRIGPGPGFFPFWIGALTLFLSLVWLVQVTRDKSLGSEGASWINRAGVPKVLMVLGALAVFSLAVDMLGFTLTMFVFMLVLIRFADHHTWGLTIAICLGGSVGVFYLFKWLEVILPTTQLPGLQWLPF